MDTSSFPNARVFVGEIMFVQHRFELDHLTKDYLQSLVPQFGYNGFGELVYYRTYSRIKSNGEQENWSDTVTRATEGTFSIRKDFYIKNKIPWEEAKWQEYAKGFASYMFDMKWMPPGRGLWAMGSDFVYERGAMALYNCSYTVLGDNTRFHKDIGWLMDCLMNGVGVGFGPERDTLRLVRPAPGRYDYIIPDTREGWVEIVELTILAYTQGKQLPYAIYDRVRKAGLPIKGFGGLSSGPEPLEKLIKRIIVECEALLKGERDIVEFKTNIANMVGCCVVAGNVRRSAEIACGSVHDKIFMDLKDYSKYLYREPWAWMCLDEDTWISTTLGPRQIKQLIDTPYTALVDGLRYKSTGFFVAGIKNLLNIEAQGFTLKCSPDHKIMTSNGWKKAGELSLGDQLRVNDVGIRTWSGRGTFDDGYLVGVVIGDGTLGIEGKCSISSSLKDEGSETVREKVLTLTANYPITSREWVMPPSHRDTQELHFSCSYLARLCGDYDITHKSKTIGPKIELASSDFCKGLLQGLFDTDGSVKKLGPNRTARGVRFSQFNKDTIQAVQRLLARFGIQSRVCEGDKSDWSRKTPYILTVRGEAANLFKRVIGFTHARKKKLIDEYFLTTTSSKKLLVTVTSITILEPKLLYDCTVEGIHAYDANGLYVSNSNNQVKLLTNEDFDELGEVAKRVTLRGEPGVSNGKNMKYGRIGKYDPVPIDKATGFNPCLIGSTKILTADGRGYVSIIDLIGQDLDVFCINAQDELCIRRMRNLRKTGENVDIYRVTFDSGDYLDVTGNHKLMLRDRSFCEASKLTYGDQLAKVNRYLPDQRSESRADQYISFSYGGQFKKCEHRLVAENKFGEISETEHIHHKDENKQNNNPNNLELTLATEHLSNHSIEEQNANYSGWSNEQLLLFGIQLCKKLGRRFSSNEWQEIAPVKSFSNWRKTEFGSIVEFAWRCADEAEVLNISIDPRTLRFYQELVSSGYECDIIGVKVFVTKVCEGCGKEFQIDAAQREQASCSSACNNTIRDYIKNIEGQRKTFAARRESLREQQLTIYTKLKLDLGRDPSKKEWIQACKGEQISAEISRESSPFRNWSFLKWAAKDHNCRVVSVKYLGKQDVYNGTVDEYHNFIIGGFQDQTPQGRVVERGVVNLQCGEIGLEDKEVCNVDETLPTMCSGPDEWYQACEYATFYCSTVSLLPTHQPDTNRVVARNRRIGISIIDFTGWKLTEGVHKVTKYLRNGYQVVTEANRQFNAEAGVPEAIRKTCIKPGGTTPKLPGKTPGAGHPTFKYTIRRIRVAQNSPIHSLLVEANIPYEKDVASDMTDVFEYPIIQGPAKPAQEVSLWEQANNVVLLQREWADNAVSNTLYFKPKWVLTNHDFTNPFGALVNYIGLMAANHTINTGKTEVILGSTKIELILRENKLTEVKFYEFDLEHEEDDIEPVLSSIIPMIKSVSLLPHSATGVYLQMPEEGISEDEYRKRISAITQIDWSKFSGSDGEDERYCVGGVCETRKPS